MMTVRRRIHGAQTSGMTRRQGLLLAGGLLGGLAGAQPAERVMVLLEQLPPYAFAGPDGRPEGYAVALVRELLARAGVVADYEFESWPRIEQQSRSRPNRLLPAIVRLPEREAQFLWVAQIAQRQAYLFRLRSRPDVQLRGIEDAKSYLTAVIKEDVAERELVALGLSVGQHLDRSADYPALLRKFFAGRCQLMAMNLALMPALLRQYGYEPQQVEPLLKFAESRPSMALSLGSSAVLHQQLLQAWAGMRRDGSAAAIAARHAMTLPD